MKSLSPGIFLFEENKNLRLQIPKNPRFVMNVIWNADFQAIYHFPVNGYHT